MSIVITARDNRKNGLHSHHGAAALAAGTDRSHTVLVAIVKGVTNSARLGISPRYGESRIVASQNADTWERGAYTSPGGSSNTGEQDGNR
jgi:hypothetical protein